MYSGLNVLLMFNVLGGHSSSKIFCICVVLMISFVKKNTQCTVNQFS
jgi:hypothetical protein